MFKKVFLLLLLILTPSVLDNRDDVRSDFVVVQINARWNTDNDVKIPSIRNCAVKYGFLEDQSESLKSNIKFVPVVLLYRRDRIVRQWSADLSFKLELTREDIERAIIIAKNGEKNK